MEKIDKILKHKLFLEHLEANNTAEADRRFCRHNMVHFLDVARIGVIINLEEEMGISKDWIYAAALLHDLGKHLQYSDGIPHEKASGEIAPGILRECGFEEKEAAIIVEAILAHRDSKVREERNLKGLLYRADKASRACFACKAEGDCNWKAGKKNPTIIY